MYFFGSQLIYITKHHFQPTTIVKQIVATHLINDTIWDNRNPCDVSIYDTNGTAALVNIRVTKELIATTTTHMSTVYNNMWYDAHEDCDLRHYVLETMAVTKNGMIYQSFQKIQVLTMNL